MPLLHNSSAAHGGASTWTTCHGRQAVPGVAANAQAADRASHLPTTLRHATWCSAGIWKHVCSPCALVQRPLSTRHGTEAATHTPKANTTVASPYPRHRLPDAWHLAPPGRLLIPAMCTPAGDPLALLHGRISHSVALSTWPQPMLGCLHGSCRPLIPLPHPSVPVSDTECQDSTTQSICSLHTPSKTVFQQGKQTVLLTLATCTCAHLLHSTYSPPTSPHPAAPNPKAPGPAA
jgi:hypothetical protein